MRNSFTNSQFVIWKKRIESHVGMELDELPDEPYRFWFEETHMTPKEIANIILENNHLNEKDINNIMK